VKCGIGWLTVVTSLAMAAGPACGQTPGAPGRLTMELLPRQARVPGEYLVTLVPGADSKAITSLYGTFGIKGVKDQGNNVFLVTLTEDPGPAKMEELRGKNALIKAVQPNFVYRTNEPGNGR
jgi:hypothetical protein